MYGMSSGIFFREETTCYAAMLVFAGLTVVGWKNRKRRERIRVNTTDVLVCIYLLYGIINIVVVRSLQVDPFVWCKWVTITGGYLLYRAGKNKRGGPHALSLSGLLQALLAIGQVSGIVESNHDLFPITGSFRNPGQLGGYLAVTSVVTCYLLVRRKDITTSRRGALHLLVFVIMLAGLYLADSRAGLMAACCGIIACYWKYIAAWFKRYRYLPLPVMLVIACCTGSLLYHYRPGSIQGRLLVWRVSVAMVAECPVLGHGVSSFASKYMPYQAAYLETFPDSSLENIADDVDHPFNEWIRAGVEQGIAGLLLVVTLLVLATRYSPSRSRPFKAGLIALFVFSCFSYPSEVFPLLFLFPLFLAALPGKTLAAFPLSRPAWYGYPGISLLALFFSVRACLFCRELSGHVLKLYSEEYNEQALLQCEKYYDVMHRNEAFNLSYLTWLGDHTMTRESLQKMDDIIPSSRTYVLLGQAYLRHDSIDRAGHAFRLAARMVPTRLTPWYFLWELHARKGDHHAARDMARKIMALPIKVENTFTLGVKARVKEYVKNNPGREP